MTKALFFFALFGATVARAEIDLTPTAGVRELDGCQFLQLEFADGASKVTYEPPRGWRYFSRGSHLLVLQSSTSATAEAKIELISKPAPLVLDEAQLQLLKSAALELVPKDAQLLGEPIISATPLSINEHATCELEVSFLLYNQKFRKSVLLVDLGTSQLRLGLIAPADDFDTLHKAFRESWYSWQWASKAEAAAAAKRAIQSTPGS